MTTKRNFGGLRGTATLALVLIGAVISTACSSGVPTAAPAKGGSTPVACAPTKSGATAANTPQCSKTNASLDCQALANAAFDLNGNEPFLITLAGAGGSLVNSVDSSFYVDTAKMRADLNVLAVLPDPTNPAEITMMGKPSEAIAQFRRLLDIVDRAAKAGPAPTGTPAADSSMTDQELKDFPAKFVRMSVAINAAVGKACPNATADASHVVLPGTQSQATPVPAGYHIGQTAPLGDLRVTLDKVVTLPGADALLPTAGNRFVFAYFTVENTGKTASQLNMTTGTHWEDATGKQYFFDPDTIMLDPSTTNFDGGVQAGAKQSGSVGYLLPTNAGDLVWIIEDFKPNRAAFAVKSSDVASVGTPVTEPTAEAMRVQAAATQTAFVEMALGAESADATQQAAGTDTPAPPAPVDTAVPEASTDTPGTADTPPPAEPTDTAPVSP